MSPKQIKYLLKFMLYIIDILVILGTKLKALLVILLKLLNVMLGLGQPCQLALVSSKIRKSF